MTRVPTLECQDCGEIIFYLDAAQSQMVARDPYNLVVLCKPCRQVQDRIDRLHGY